MTKPSPRKPRLSRELVDSLLPPAPPPAKPGSAGTAITIQVAEGPTVTVVVTRTGAQAGAD